MNTKTLSPRTLSIIDQYLNFKLGSATCSVPYFNNRTVHARAALRAYVGKGSPRDIYDEAQAVIVKARVDTSRLDGDSLKRFLTDQNIGIDCSALAYYVLNAESEESGHGSLDRRLRFVNCHGIIGRLRSALRPVENCDVATLSDDHNSRQVPLGDIRPGDFVSMMDDSASGERDHILIIHQVDYQNMVPFRAQYTHAVAYPTDGVYGTGLKQGAIDILRPESAILEARWTENGREGMDIPVYARATRSKTSLRRLS